EMRMSGIAKEIELGDDFGEVVVEANGAHVLIHAYGQLESHRATTAPANAAAKMVVKPGDRMEDGTIYAGISPDTGGPMYTMSADIPGSFDLFRAEEYAGKFPGHGDRKWRVPSKDELNVLFNERAAIGGFDQTGIDPAGWYWSSSRDIYDN